jgi:hypothetical protein
MKDLIAIAQRASLPDSGEYLALIVDVLEVLRTEDPLYRPRDEQDRAGGLIRLGDLPTIVVPDLHGRTWFLLHVLNHRIGGRSVAELLHGGEIQIVCVGDGFHAEARAVKRWQKAFKEFAGKYRRHAAMDEEMRENLGLMEMVMRLKIAFPSFFHFLKGNHENILNEEGRGNHPFRKFAYEGEMVKDWVFKFYGEEFIEQYAEFEHELPLVAADRTFMISHAEPMESYSREEVIRYREYDDVVLGLTWTPDGGAEDGSVEQMIAEFCSDGEQAVYFGGHRPVAGKYNLRAGDLYVQLHNPSTYSIAVLQPGVPVDLERDIAVLPRNDEAVIRDSEKWPEWE